MHDPQERDKQTDRRKETSGLNPEPEMGAQFPRRQRQALLPGPTDGHYQVKPLTTLHLPLAVPVLSQAFPDSLLPALGPAFLAELLDSYVSLPGGCGYTCWHGEQVVGFVVGTEDSRRHRRLLLHRRWAPILVRVVHGLIASPRRAGPLARYLRSFLSLPWPPGRNHGERDDGTPVPPASLVLLGVLPAQRRRGVGERLTRAFLDEMAERGVGAVKLAVAADNEAALAFYLSLGWRVAGRYSAPEGSTAYRLIYRLP